MTKISDVVIFTLSKHAKLKGSIYEEEITWLTISLLTILRAIFLKQLYTWRKISWKDYAYNIFFKSYTYHRQIQSPLVSNFINDWSLAQIKHDKAFIINMYLIIN